MDQNSTIKETSANRKKIISKKQIKSTLLVEVSWEACNQVGGIYTVLRSKAPFITQHFRENYCLIGPSVHHNVPTEFEELPEANNPFALTVKKMQELGFDVKYGKWLVSGRPNLVLINPFCVYHNLGDIKYQLWEHHDISFPDEELINQTVAFGSLVKVFFNILTNKRVNINKVIAHFHEWMAGIPIPELRFENIPVSIVFTTHATLLGRYLAMNDPEFYNHLPFFDWQKEARYFNIEASVKLERAATHGCHVFTTVSDITASECQYLLNRKPDHILPNGINIERFSAMHEFQNLHKEYKSKIDNFVIGHFFQSYTFNLENTLYFFTSGRFEFRNKGFGITLEALARLNYMMKRDKIERTIVMFFITRQPSYSINPDVLHSRAMMHELKNICQEIERQVGTHLFYESAGLKDHSLPRLNDYVEDYLKLKFRRTLQSWKSHRLPPVVTHNLVNDRNDEILNFLRSANMVNNEEDRVKIVYHPDFITHTNPLFSGMEYSSFVRGCNLGIFPSYYEPWGYTPLESLASGIPAVTSNLSGFGDFVVKHITNHKAKGIYVIDKINQNFDQAAQQLANNLYEFVKQDRRSRIEMRNRAEASSVQFDWSHLGKNYLSVYKTALDSPLISQ